MGRPRTAKPRSSYHAAFGHAIKILMAEQPGLTLDTVVADSGLDEKQIGTYIRGQGNPTLATLVKLCDGLHVRPSTLMARTDELYERQGR
jgi:transcriptional regulator with XRE-family HTH domain